MTAAALATDQDRAAPMALWRAMREFLLILHTLFGAPEEVAARVRLPAAFRKQMLQWIAAGEAFMRRLLIVEAAALPRAIAAAPAARAPARTRAQPDHSAVEAWRTAFRCLMERIGKRRCSARVRQPPHAYFAARPLAMRLEALVRVFNNPAPFAARLARRLRAKPQRAGALFHAWGWARHCIDPAVTVAADDATAEAIASFDSS